MVQGQMVKIGGGVEVGDVSLQYFVFVVGGGWDVFEDVIEQWLQVGGIG